MKPTHVSLVDKAQEKLEQQRNQIDVLQQEIAKINKALKNIEVRINTKQYS